ncbi:uncharacterized protein LOC125863738 [Solanum stenotomum]|uniref:uncharacterized protein LOC125863738 n=1 Tax=Solanum stenotomum TaxID=172797 RepID=UPI0020D0F974|nr:uncharacterized protein LOC125863738 [Solanum stenotomum]
MKRARPDEQNQSRSKKRFFNQESSMVNNDRVSNPKPHRGNGGGSNFKRPRCATCEKQHLGKCLADTDGCFGCGSKGHKMLDCPTLKAKGKETNQVAHDGPDPNAPKRNHFYLLQAKRDKGLNGGTDGCSGCGSKGHKIRECLTLKAKGKETNQVAHDGPGPNAPKRNCFYLFKAKKDKGTNEGC